MTRGVFRYLVAPLVCVGLLSGCRFDMFDRREPWRAQAEEQCLAEKGVTVSAYVEPMSAIDGRGACGMEHPFKVAAFADGAVEVSPRATLACPMIRNLNGWLDEVVQPAAMAWLGQPVAGIRQMSSYSCRGMNGSASAKISEHAFGNALDIGAFVLADGRVITIKDNWRGPQEARGFLLQVQAGACEMFTTTLAPGSNIFHYDHIHVDLMRRANRPVICQPAPRPMPPPVQMVRQPMQQPPLQQPAPQMLPPQAGQPPFPGGQGRPAPASLPGREPVGAPLDIMPHPPEHGLDDAEDASAPAAGAQPPYGQPPRQPPGAPQAGAPADAYGRGPYQAPRVWSPSGDPRQPVLMPPGSVPQPDVPRPPGPMSSAPPGWNVGPAPARSYAGDAPGAVGPFATGSVTGRKYYSVPLPQASPIPLPTVEPGTD